MSPDEREVRHTDDADSIYRAPQSQTAFAPKGDLLMTYVGPKNNDYYQRQFDKFRSGSGVVTWHWPAFFLASFWLLYRKMWLYALGYWLGLPIALTALSFVLARVAGQLFADVTYNVIYLVCVFLLMPMFANWFYYRHAVSKVDRVTTASPSPEQQSIEVARIGGTSNIVLVLAPVLVISVIGILAAIAIPAYQDYTIRAQVAEGMSLASGARVAVAELYQREGVLARDNLSAGLPSADQLSGHYVSSIEVDDGEITITYGKDASPLIGGKSLLLTPEEYADQTLSWHCHSASLQPKHLPASCR